MRINMKFPIIEITDNADSQKTPRIVGTNSHDVLEVDEETGGIHYFNLQCCEGTMKLPGKPDHEGFSFVGEENEWDYNPVIRFVSFEELCEIYLEQTKQSIENEKELRSLMQEVIRECDAMTKELEGEKGGLRIID